jgi:hypothetical protein
MKTTFIPSNYVYVNNPTYLCEIAQKYNTDKTPKRSCYHPQPHTYTPCYYNLMKDKMETCEFVLEIGVGDNPLGASLKMWNDFFKNAIIIGLDYNRNLLFKDVKIDTFYTDQNNINELEITKKEIIRKYPAIKNRLDFIIDDGCHEYTANINTLSVYWDLVAIGGCYIIEDILYDEFDKYLNISMIDQREIIAYKTQFEGYGTDNNFICYKK